VLDGHLHLLDRLIVDADGTPVCMVDDVEIDELEPGRSPHVGALVSGFVRWTRTFGGHPRPGQLETVPWHDVTDIDVVIQVVGDADSYGASWHEGWVRDQFISRIPGGDHAPE
jgi:hypothetical protein